MVLSRWMQLFYHYDRQHYGLSIETCSKDHVKNGKLANVFQAIFLIINQENNPVKTLKNRLFRTQSYRLCSQEIRHVYKRFEKDIQHLKINHLRSNSKEKNYHPRTNHSLEPSCRRWGAVLEVRVPVNIYNCDWLYQERRWKVAFIFAVW